ncbi:hypothetical protein V5738_10165 [Salinisphaera sp. SPP-AMP-43]|uniref:hypothetical protein n=1 Tax=Salinisphaera sp. SPP-AMP-43 TaxID=3121288 RepID=UPI003C6E9D3B
MSVRKLGGTGRLCERDWRLISFSLEYHNQRLESILSGLNSYAGLLAFLAALAVILARNLGPSNWAIFVIVAYFVFWGYAKRARLICKIRENAELKMLIDFGRRKTI